MGVIDMMRSSIDRIGVSVCSLEFEKINFVFREQTIVDYGIDAIIELRDGDSLSGKLIGVQIKSGESYFKIDKNGYITFRGDYKHYNYWNKYVLPVIIVIYVPSLNQCYWELFDKNKIDLC